MSAKTRLASAALLASAACHFQPTPVPLSGARSSIATLAGTWSGSYRGTESGRTGSIEFSIRVTADSAFGDVSMDPGPEARVFNPVDDPATHLRHAGGPRLLAIRFVDIVGGDVEGALEPYVAPDCECTVRTTFTGRVLGDTVRGTFVTRSPMIAPQSGVWAVARQPRK